MRAAATLAWVALAACTRPEPTAGTQRAAPRGERAPRADRQVVTGRAPAPSFRRDVAPVLERHCAAAADCHGAQPTESVVLDLRAAAAWAELVGRPAAARPGALRVAPGDPAASFLVDKITGALRAREGKPMPVDPETGAPLEPNPLAGAFVDEVLRPWIAAGAPNN